MNINYLNLLNDQNYSMFNNFNLLPICDPKNLIPPGLHSLYLACHQVYPNRINPMQIISVRKYWLGGNDPLDYINYYDNPGDSKKNIPPHWHYISFGLSDLYGDGRVHPRLPSQELSGFGFELTFRLKKEPGQEKVPPFWPAKILQSLAKYVFYSGNIFCPGDHVSENKPLDSVDNPNSTSKIQHMLMTDDPQLGTVFTPLGKVTFIQIVGVTKDELKASQEWNVSGIIELMKKIPEAGSELLITDMERQNSIFELNSKIKQAVEEGINKEGSNLSGVSAKCSFKSKISFEDFKSSDEDNTSSIEDNSDDFDEEEFDEEEEQTTSESSNQLKSSNEDIKNEENDKLISKNQENYDIAKLNDDLSKITITKEKNHKSTDKSNDTNELSNYNQNSNGQETTNNERIISPRVIISPNKSECSSSMSVSHDNNNQNNCASGMSYSSETGGNEPVNFFEIKYLNEVHIYLNLEAGLLLPLVLRGRLKHNHHFTYKSTNLAITFLTPSVSGAYVSVEKPFGYYGSWLQILLENSLVEKMIFVLEDSEHKLKPDKLPKTFCWNNLAITIVPEE